MILVKAMVVNSMTLVSNWLYLNVGYTIYKMCDLGHII